MSFSIKNFTSLINVSVANKASDIHIRTDEVPCLRIRGELIPIQTKTFTIEDIKDIIKILLRTNDQYYDFTVLSELDGAFALPDICRMRFSIFRYFNNLGIIIRLVKNTIPSIESLEMPPIMSKIALKDKGLILVTGPTGSGKTTTLAALINQINESKPAHIITIEDPIEYLHTQKKARISQREIHSDTESFSSGLRSALRQDPDVISIGEMRDSATLEIALRAAETGQLVLSTLHTNNCLNTINRLIAMYSEHEQVEARKRLANNLYAIISQKMLKGKEGRSILAQEILIINPAIKECILGIDDMEKIPSIIAQSALKSNSGGQSFDQHIMQLYQNNLISKETAIEAVSAQAEFNQILAQT